MQEAELGESSVAGQRHHQTLALLSAIVLIGALAAWRPLATWLALGLYLVGSLALLSWRALGCGEADAVFLAGPGLRGSLFWGGCLGAGLLVVGWFGLPAMRAAMAMGDAGPPLETIRRLLFGRGLVLLLPLLVLAEEGLWRGLVLSGLLDNGRSATVAVLVSSLGFALNHLVVAPLPVVERAALALMALPLGLAAATLTLATRCLWGAALLHLLVIGAMLGSLR